MAELPELETLRRDLDRDIGGKRIKTVEVPGSGAIPRHTNKKQFVTLLEGVKVTGIVRRDLLLVAKLDSGDALVIDIQKGGQLRRQAAKEAVDKRTKVVVTFTQGGQLRAIDDTGNLELFVDTEWYFPQRLPADMAVDREEVAEVKKRDRIAANLKIVAEQSATAAAGNANPVARSKVKPKTKAARKKSAR